MFIIIDLGIGSRNWLVPQSPSRTARSPTSWTGREPRLGFAWFPGCPGAIYAQPPWSPGMVEKIIHVWNPTARLSMSQSNLVNINWWGHVLKPGTPCEHYTNERIILDWDVHEPMYQCDPSPCYLLDLSWHDRQVDFYYKHWHILLSYQPICPKVLIMVNDKVDWYHWRDL